MRPKGSKNKAKEEVKPVVVAPKPIGHSVYIPTPDMGDIKPPPEGKKVCGCTHEKETHYGGARGHCNSSGCECLEFK
jgi:hypothetical protein